MTDSVMMPIDPRDTASVARIANETFNNHFDNVLNLVTYVDDIEDCAHLIIDAGVPKEAAFSMYCAAKTYLRINGHTNISKTVSNRPAVREVKVITNETDIGEEDTLPNISIDELKEY